MSGVRSEPHHLSPPSRTVVGILIVVGLVATLAGLFVDLPESRGGVKGDESTYIAMALSLAFDGDLAYSAEDVARFRGIVRTGPEGIFLKRGRDVRLRFTTHWPFVVNDGALDAGTSRLYFGKAWVHALLAAPFVRALGLNGLVVLNIVLLWLVVAAGYGFARTRAPDGVALALSAGFIGATVAPVYVFWLTPEVLNLALVFFSYFLFFYKDVARTPGGRWGRLLTHPATDIAALVLLGLATFSKPPNLALIGAPLLWRVWQRQWLRAATLVILFLGVVVLAFAATLLITGEANYQGGDRKTFYGSFPFDGPGATFDTRGVDMATDTADAGDMFDPREFWERLRHNAVYFFVGRHFGLVPWHFPGVAIAVFWLARPRTWRSWQVGAALSAAATAVVLLIYTPLSWSGGGGPLGNRYFLSIYPALFFLLPPVTAAWPAVVVWLGGLVCSVNAFVHPIDVAHRPGLASERGPARMLPVELTMVNDLPVMLTASRARIPYGTAPDDVFLYLLDPNVWPPEDGALWVRGGTRGDVIVRSGEQPVRLVLTLYSLVENRVRVSAGGASREIPVPANERVTVTLNVRRPVFSKRSYAFVLSVAPERGAEPRQLDPASSDPRYLGVQMVIQPRLAR